MGIVRTKGIVIKIANSSEHDKILTVLTADRGKIRVFCKGAKKLKSAFLASTEYLCFSDMMLFEGNGDMYSLNSAEPINVFYNFTVIFSPSALFPSPNAPRPSFLTECGKNTSRRALHSANARAPIVCTPSEILTLRKRRQA